MNKAVQIEQKDPAKVAKAFLQANHLALIGRSVTLRRPVPRGPGRQ